MKESARELRELLKRQVLQKEGICQGREVARQALARKKEECAQLKVQVRELEEQRARAEMAQETMRSQMFELTNELGTWIRFNFWWEKPTNLMVELVKLSQTQKCEYDDVEEGEINSLDTSYLYIN